MRSFLKHSAWSQWIRWKLNHYVRCSLKRCCSYLFIFLLFLWTKPSSFWTWLAFKHDWVLYFVCYTCFPSLIIFSKMKRFKTIRNIFTFYNNLCINTHAYPLFLNTQYSYAYTYRYGEQHYIFPDLFLSMNEGGSAGPPKGFTFPLSSFLVLMLKRWRRIEFGMPSRPRAISSLINQR